MDDTKANPNTAKSVSPIAILASDPGSYCTLLTVATRIKIRKVTMSNLIQSGLIRNKPKKVMEGTL